MKQRIAVFDFDGTLTAGDSYTAFARHAVGMPRLLYALLRTAPSLAAWRLGFIDGARAKEALTRALYEGMSLDDFRTHCRKLVPVIESMLRKDVMERLEEHQRRGDRVIIVSASIDEWIRPWAELHGIEAVLATGLERDGRGRLTGRFSTPNCRGDEKVRRLRALLGDLGKYEISVYGDSPEGDGPLLAIADHAHRV